MQNLQTKSHEALLKLLNNIGIVGAVLAAVADIVFVIIMVVGVDIKANLTSVILFAVINALVGILINFLLRYQGKKYAETENDELCKKFYNKKIKEKRYISMGTWMTLHTIKDFIIKGCTTAFSIFGIVYISIQGSKNPIQILMTFATLILFACFGLMSMNSAYVRFYNIQVPYMKLQIEAREQNKAKKTKRKTKSCVSTNTPEATSAPTSTESTEKQDVPERAISGALTMPCEANNLGEIDDNSTSTSSDSQG